MKHKQIALIISILTMCLLTGCGTKVIELTATEQAVISEYAADAILEYCGIRRHKIIDELVQQESKEENADDTIMEEILEKLPEEKEPENEIQVHIPEQDTVSGNANITIEDFFGIEGVQIVYKDYSVVKNFPEDSAEDFYLSMGATEGNSLLVLKFDVINQTGGDYQADMLSYNMNFKIGVNGGAKRWALSTMLLNDLATYCDVIPAGEAIELVLIVEIPEATNVETISLMMKNGDNSIIKDLK